MSDNLVVYPLVVMLFLPFLVMSKMFLTRVSDMKKNRIHPQALAVRVEAAKKYTDTKSADNFLNLFELPIVFYVVSLLFIFNKNYSQVTIILMWVFVVLRYIHSIIHSTYNKVMHRFYAFAISSLTLFVLLINFVINLK